MYVGEQNISEPAEKGTQQVTRLCEELQTMLTVEMAESPRHAVWLLLAESAARKLDYDARVCPWNELKDAAEKCETDVINTLQHLAGRMICRHKRDCWDRWKALG